MARYQPTPPPTESLFFLPIGSRWRIEIGARRHDWHAFAAAYKTAADVLLEKLHEGTTMGENACVPVLYLYRHHIELLLKALLRDFGELADTLEQPPGRHELRGLWDRFRGALVVHGLAASVDWLDQLQSWIDELDMIDAGSFTFRYPTNKTGQPVLPNVRAIDVQHFRAVVRDISSTLNGAAAMVGEYLDIKRDSQESFGP